MRKCLAFLFLSFLSGIFAAPFAVSAAIVVNEVLFDPVGTDTTLEKIELYNPDTDSQNMSGWELYPDGIGYFIFPQGFTLGPKSFVTVHLRLSGTSDASNLYHSITKDENMGDSSGSVAIFSGKPYGKDTIIDFVRYKKGTSDTKTWESAASAAGLWLAGQFVDISTLQAGNSIGLATDGFRSSATAWKIFQAPTIGGSNGGGGSLPPSPQAGTTTPSLLQVAPAPRPSLGADAGPDITALAGALVVFRGMAFGLDGEPLPGARFLWNFGDGWVQEGKSLNHVYYFPGTYHVNLSVSSGEYTGSDWRIITVIPPALVISEAQPGDNGFVELFNASDQSIDLGGINLTDEAQNIFRIPAGTVVGAGAVIVFANVISGLNPSSTLTLRDARPSLLDEAKFSEVLPGGASFERSGETFVAAAAPTPGKFNPKTGEQKIVSSVVSIPSSPRVLPNPSDFYRANIDATATASPPAAAEAPLEQNPAEAQDKPDNLRTLASIIGANVFFAASIILGLTAAAGFILVKRKIP